MADVAPSEKAEFGSKVPILQTAKAISVSFCICKTATYLTKVCGFKGGDLPGITAIAVLLATVFPAQFTHLAPAGDTLALILMQASDY